MSRRHRKLRLSRVVGAFPRSDDLALPAPLAQVPRRRGRSVADALIQRVYRFDSEIGVQRWVFAAIETREMRARLYSLDEIKPMIVERWGLAPDTSNPKDDRT